MNSLAQLIDTCGLYNLFEYCNFYLFISLLFFFLSSKSNSYRILLKDAGSSESILKNEKFSKKFF